MSSPCPPFAFLTALPVANTAAACLYQVRLASDTTARLLLAQANFSLCAYQPQHYAQLQLHFPPSLAAAVPKRQAEYLAGRYLSRLAMQQTGLFQPAPPELLSGALRAPAWPDNITGSVTHHQHCAAVVVLTQPLAADSFVGIDTELWLDAQQAGDIATSIHMAEEQNRLQKAGLSASQATTLLFSAKEALFKAICPFVGGYFGFDAAQLRSCTVNAGTEGWLELQLTTDWVAARAPQLRYRCWFRCSELDVLTLVCSDALSEPWRRSLTVC